MLLSLATLDTPGLPLLFVFVSLSLNGTRGLAQNEIQNKYSPFPFCAIFLWLTYFLTPVQLSRALSRTKHVWYCGHGES